jgi:transcriptional regulator with XRE-family HTH domain
MTLADEIKAVMSENGVTAYRAAKDTGVSEATLSKFFSGKRGLSDSAMKALLDYLGYELVVTIRKKRKPAKPAAARQRERG